MSGAPGHKARIKTLVLAAVDAGLAAREQRAGEYSPLPAANAPPARPVPAGIAGTLPSEGNPLEKVMAAMRCQGSNAPAGGEPSLVLTVEQYVSLRADLLVRPGESAETLKRYGIPGPAAHRALEARWRQELAASAELRARLDAAIAMFARLLRGEAG